MNGEQLMNMDAHMLLSIVNMKLRNTFADFESLCDDLYIDLNTIENKLADIGYYYSQEHNQFVPK